MCLTLTCSRGLSCGLADKPGSDLIRDDAQVTPRGTNLNRWERMVRPLHPGFHGSQRDSHSLGSVLW